MEWLELMPTSRPHNGCLIPLCGSLAALLMIVAGLWLIIAGHSVFGAGLLLIGCVIHAISFYRLVDIITSPTKSNKRKGAA